MLEAYRRLGVANKVMLTHLICGSGESLAINPTYWMKLSTYTRQKFSDRWNSLSQNNFETPIIQDLNIFV